MPLQYSVRVQDGESEVLSPLCIVYQSTGQKPRGSDLTSRFASHSSNHIHNFTLKILFLRKQLEIVTRTSPKLRLRPSERFFMGILTDLFDSWKEALLIFKPETVIRWHGQSFRVFWKWKSRSTPGRPAIPQAQINLVKQMANDNPLWGAPRIHGEMLKLGFDISEATVQRYMPRRPQRTTQRTHLGVNKDSPEPREVQAEGEIDKVAVVNGLHHYYFRRAA